LVEDGDCWDRRRHRMGWPRTAEIKNSWPMISTRFLISHSEPFPFLDSMLSID
jgi:hypothetical protein